MPSLVSCLFSLGIASLASSSPLLRKRGTFTIEESVAVPLAPGPVSLANTYQKFGKTVPADVLAAAADGSVTATPEEYDQEYLCPVDIGGQTLNLDFDTGSADL